MHKAEGGPSTLQAYPTSTPHLRVVRDEDTPNYDGEPNRRPFVMTDQESGRTILATLGGACFGVYWTLQRHADKAGTCWPSLDTLADANHLSRMHVTRCLTKLEEGGWITRTKRATTRGLSTSTLYTVSANPSKSGCNTRRTSDEHASVVDVTRTRPKLDENQDTPSLRSGVSVTPSKRLLPDDWEPTPTMVETAAAKHGMTLVQVADKTEQFRDWAKSSGKKYLDWDATWRNFMRPSRFDPYPARSRGANANGKLDHMQLANHFADQARRLEAEEAAR